MCPDRVVSHAKRSVGVNNIYHPSGLVDKMNTVCVCKHVIATRDCLHHLSNLMHLLTTPSYNTPGHIDHEISVPFHEGWEQSLKAHYRPIPAISEGGYTSGHFYEFCDSKVTIRDMIDTEPFYVHSYCTVGTAGLIRENLLRRVFGNVPFEIESRRCPVLQDAPKAMGHEKIEQFQGEVFLYPDGI
jgi:hypothetical protein